MSTDTKILMSIAEDIGTLKSEVRAMRSEVSPLAERVRSLETARAFMKGYIAFAGAAFGAAFALITAWVKERLFS